MLRADFGQQRSQRARLASHRIRLAIEIDEQVALAFRHDRLPQMLARRAQGKGVGDLQRRGQETRGERSPAPRSRRLWKVRKLADNDARAGGSGSRRSVASVTTPSRPSLPTNMPIRSKPVLFLCVRPPVRSTRPSASTTSSPST